jgi:hypothetical protein
MHLLTGHVFSKFGTQVAFSLTLFDHQPSRIRRGNFNQYFNDVTQVTKGLVARDQLVFSI